MSRPFDPLASSDIDLGIKEDLPSPYKIRNECLWALLSVRELVYVDLNFRPNPQVHMFAER
jgi:predicted nucleotidyltransferase